MAHARSIRISVSDCVYTKLYKQCRWPPVNTDKIKQVGADKAVSTTSLISHKNTREYTTTTTTIFNISKIETNDFNGDTY